MQRMLATRRGGTVIVFLVLFASGLIWSLYTQHAWEDYYITYRASKNLATGHGLTFTVGERVHSFTSPLGVLLPAVASLLTGNSSDRAALWIFRLMSIAALGGAGVFLWKSARELFSTRFAAGLLLALLATDTKIVDFSTNGMETGFLLLFLSWTLYALLISPEEHARQLGFAWAGLMWTRPDSFIYIGVLALGALVFIPAGSPRGTRRKLLKTFLAAGCITAALYLPWLLWASAYYGTPIPHTIIAKGLFNPPTTLASFWQAVRGFVSVTATHRDILATTFMPPYSFNTGWPAGALVAAFWLAVAVIVVWILPGVRREARVASLAFSAGQFYLRSYVGFPVPWYIPTLTVFAFVVIASLIDQVISYGRMPSGSGSMARLAGSSRRWLGRGVAVTLVAASMTISVMAAHQLRWQQKLIEEGQRREIGLWLQEQAADSHETVFLEPLGYIGFNSNLKMLDYPGLSSPEMIAARQRASSHSYPDCWAELIMDLTPNWLVLRSYEVEAIRSQSPELFSRYYTLVRTFDVRAKVSAISSLAGRGYLINDAYFEVYRRKPGIQHENSLVGLRPIGVKNFSVNESWGQPAYQSGANLVAHAPSRLVFKKPVGARWLSGGFGLFDGAYADPHKSTDGAVFTISLIAPGGTKHELLKRPLDPRNQAADRGLQSFSVELPTAGVGSLELSVSPGPHNDNAFDWSYWSGLQLEFPHQP